MFDTMTSTKIIGALSGTFLIFLFANWASESLYHVAPEGHDGEASNAYVIETDEGVSEEAVEEVVDFAAILASADVDKGAKVFGKCKACHKLEDGANSTGPTLFGIVGRDVASVAGFGYSGVLSEMAGGWTPEALNGFLESPKAYASGTKMTFSGLKKIEDRANLIAYLGTIGS